MLLLIVMVQNQWYYLSSPNTIKGLLWITHASLYMLTEILEMIFITSVVL